VGMRRSNLLRKKQWTPDHQAFHDFYVDRLKYDFKGTGRPIKRGEVS
jgi:hypothetical protein